MSALQWWCQVGQQEEFEAQEAQLPESWECEYEAWIDDQEQEEDE